MSVLSGCTTSNSNPSTTPSESGGSTPSGGGGGSGGGETPPGPSGPVKKTVAAHTLSDSNAPITIGGKGDVVTESLWNSFKYGAASKFKGHYNFQFSSMSGGVIQQQLYTKNGCFLYSSAGRLYYERKSGNTFYVYSQTSEGYLRSTTTFDLEARYEDVFYQQIKVHMFDFSNYEYDSYDGSYSYRTFDFGSTIIFQNGYITHFQYGLSGSSFTISKVFETSINIPASYYYE